MLKLRLLNREKLKEKKKMKKILTWAILCILCLSMFMVLASKSMVQASQELVNSTNANLTSDPPNAVPSSILYWVSVTLTNNQPVATPSPFQQMIQVESANYSQYEASNLQNIEFFNNNGMVISSWLESGDSNMSTDTIYWLNVPSIPANSETTIYIGFASPSTNLFNNQTTGEAPQLSSLYGQYDSGTNVFPFYDNFAGNTLQSFWTPYVNGGAITVNNGLTIQGNPGSLNGYGSVTEIDTPANGAEFTGPSVFDVYFRTGQNPNFRFGFRDTDLCDVQDGLSGNGIAVGYGSGANGIVAITSTASKPSTSSTSYTLTSPPNANYDVFSIAATSSIAQYYLNYAATSPSAVHTNIPSYNPSIGIGLEENFVSTAVNVTWVRTRSYPPNGVMPEVAVSTTITSVSTNIPSWMQWWFWTIIALGVIVVVLASTTVHYRKKPPISKETSVIQSKTAQKGIKTCPNCGANLPADSKFCGKCGTSLE